MPVFPTNLAQRRCAFALSVVAVALIALAATGARADDDEDATFEQGIIRGLLGGSSKPPIEYRERSPLVIPPSADALPPPDATASVNNPAWPQDPDKRKPGSNKARRAMGAGEAEREGARNLRPDEMRRGAAAQPRDNKPASTQSDNEQARALRPAEYGENRSIFNFFKNEQTADAEAFKSEPTRSKMTEPPAGYRTPSAAQPYREPKDAPGSWFRALNPFDRGANY